MERLLQLSNALIARATRMRRSSSDGMLPLGRLCGREAGVGSGVAEAMNHE